MITFQWTWPHSDLLPNNSNGHHFGKRLNPKEAAKDEARLLALPYRGTVAQNRRLALSVTFYPPDLRHRDLDNLIAALKPYIDGMAEGLNVNDKKIKRIVAEQVEGKFHAGAVVVELSYAEAL